METQTIRKLSLWNLEIIFPTILSGVLGIYLYRDSKSDFTQAIAIAFFAICVVGLIFISYQLLTKITIDNTGISRVFLGNVRKIKFDQIKTFEIYKTGRFGNKKLNKSDIHLQNLDVKAERIILISKTENQKPSPWWKKNSNTISIPFQYNVFKLIENKMKK